MLELLPDSFSIPRCMDLPGHSKLSRVCSGWPGLALSMLCCRHARALSRLSFSSSMHGSRRSLKNYPRFLVLFPSAQPLLVLAIKFMRKYIHFLPLFSQQLIIVTCRSPINPTLLSPRPSFRKIFLFPPRVPLQRPISILLTYVEQLIFLFSHCRSGAAALLVPLKRLIKSTGMWSLV
ncbi:hypothetical protein B0H13DRAFT_184504 [Mycena leptocephala]|nr:hypothetical protein B0H13DRAFT_184504 [Mycena leptocephala]